MPQKAKPNSLRKELRNYRYKYLGLRYTNLDESSTRVIVNHLLSDVLGYAELSDIKTEFSVNGGYIDYLIEINSKKRFIVEVKPISAPLSPKHLRQAFYYAAVTGVEWIILTNSKEIELHRLSFTKPIKIEKILSIDLSIINDNTLYLLSHLTKKSVANNELNDLLGRFTSLARVDAL